MEKIKITIMSLVGIFGSIIANALGGWSAAMATLVIFMAIDYITGFMLAMVFKKSPKTQTGALSSGIGFKGLCKKGMIFLFIFVAVRLDVTLGIDFVKNATILAFITNELVSIVENAGLMGFPVPKVILNMIDVLKRKGDEEDGKN